MQFCPDERRVFHETMLRRTRIDCTDSSFRYDSETLSANQSRGRSREKPRVLSLYRQTLRHGHVARYLNNPAKSILDVVCAGTTGTGGAVVVTAFARTGTGATVVTGTATAVVAAFAGIEIGAGAGVARAEAMAEKSNADVTVGGGAAITEAETGIATGVGDDATILAGITVGAGVDANVATGAVAAVITVVLAGVRMGIDATTGVVTVVDAGVASPLAIEAKSNIGGSGDCAAGADGTAVFIAADTKVAASEAANPAVTGNFDI